MQRKGKVNANESPSMKGVPIQAVKIEIRLGTQGGRSACQQSAAVCSCRQTHI